MYIYNTIYLLHPFIEFYCTTMATTKKVNSKGKKLVVRKPKPTENTDETSSKVFRLFDFKTFDNVPSTITGDDSDNSSVDSGKKSSPKMIKNNRLFRIQMFGLNEKGESCLIYVDGYCPFFYVQVDAHWTNTTVYHFQEYLREQLKGYNKECLKSATLVEHDKLYEFTGNTKFKFVKLTFTNMDVFNKAKNLWFQMEKTPEGDIVIDEDGRKKRIYVPLEFMKTKLYLYESKIPPLLRYFHIHEISPSGWIQVSNYTIPSKKQLRSSCMYEYICTPNGVVPLPQKETLVPYKICSFDIEASSSHGDFPLPKKDYKRLVSQITDAFLVRIQKGDLQSSDKKRADQLLKQMIYAAFSIGTMENIDEVYPKVKHTKAHLKDKIQKLLSSSLDQIKKEIKDEQKEKGSRKNAKICSMFEKIADDAKSLMKIGANGGEQDNEDNGGGGGEMIGGFGSNIGDISEQPLYYGANKDKENIQAQQGNMSLTDVLLDNTYTRESKIQILNEYISQYPGFPELKGDEVTFIGSTFMKYGTSEPYKNHCIVVGSCDDIPNAEVVSVKTETTCLQEWTKMIRAEDPDIIIGYNIFGFDYAFMFQRAKELNIVEKFMDLSRIQGEKCYKENEKNEQSLEMTKNRLASGDYELHYPGISGRLQIDLLFYYRRDYNLSSYKLDDVAGNFIRDDIKGIEFGQENGCDITKLYSKNLAGLNVYDFIHIEITTFTVDYYMKGKKFQVQDIIYNVVIENHDNIANGKYNVIVLQGHYSDLNAKKQVLKWGMAKDDVSPQDIFRLSRGSSEDRAVVAKYCIQDCNLVQHLMKKTDVLTGYNEMARICNVPIRFLVFRGQGIKLTSYVAKVCREKNTLMPDLEHGKSDDGYEGAIVLAPKCAMYGENPVACNDYSSLYPSIAKAWNLSPNSKVWTKLYDNQNNLVRINDVVLAKCNPNQKAVLIKQTQLYDNLPEYRYIETSFDHFESVQTYTTNGKLGRKIKEKRGVKVCRWAQFPNGQEGIIPCIIGDLLKARKETRVKAESESDPFLANVLDKRQLGYKVTANSLYGQMGSSVSTFFEKDVAASITSIGRMMITYARRMVEEIYENLIYEKTDGNARISSVRTRSAYVYGDSVACYTPICVRIKNQIHIVSIESLAETFGNNHWVTCTEPGKQTKEYCELNGVESWTEKGWTNMHRVIRHKLASHKKIIRVLTHTGLVDVTDDHSLVKQNGEEISPKNVQLGTELLHHHIPEPCTNTLTSNISIEEARIMGFFFGDGSCGSYKCTSGKKSSWALNNSCIVTLEYYQTLCTKVYPSFTWKCLPTYESSGVYKLVPQCHEYGSIAKFVEKYRNMLYLFDAKKIPSGIINNSLEIRQAFFDGLYDADGDKDKHGYTRIDQKNQISASHICYLAQSLGWNTSINTRDDKPNVFRITMTKNTQRKNPCAIKKLNTIPYEGYVYDLTTANHHFAAGIGNMIVHNTDSVFFTFNLEDVKTGKPIRGKEALEWTIEIAQEAAHLCSLFLPPPMKLAYEKTLMSFILLSKKRYVGMLYETDPNKGKLKFMGLPLKRRDSCDYVKDVYGGILTILMKEPDNISKAIEFLNTMLKRLVEGNVSMEKLAITKSLRSNYKNPSQIAHRVLADRIGEREPGNKPKPGDRIKYVFVTNDDTKCLLGERIETPDYIIKNDIPLDYTYYITNQLMNPLQQLLSLAIEKIYEYKNKKPCDFREYRKNIDSLRNTCEGDLEMFMKKREKYCSSQVKLLLFDPFLTDLYNKKHGIQTLLQFYKKKA